MQLYTKHTYSGTKAPFTTFMT